MIGDHMHGMVDKARLPMKDEERTTTLTCVEESTFVVGSTAVQVVLETRRYVA